MHLTSDISLKLIQERNDKDDRGPKCEILFGGEPTGKIIGGAILKAAVQWQDRILLFVTYNCPFEESLDILLLDKELNIIDRASIFWIYSAGFFKDLQLIEPDTLRFEFFGEDLWEIQLLSKPKGRIPFISESCFVSRPFGFSRQFIVRGTLPPPMTREDAAKEKIIADNYIRERGMQGKCTLNFFCMLRSMITENVYSSCLICKTSKRIYEFKASRKNRC